MNKFPASTTRHGQSWWLGAIALMALLLFVGAPWLIKPYSGDANWYESAAFFPRVVLVVTFLAAFAHVLRVFRRRTIQQQQADELDASTSRASRAFLALAAFVGYALLTPITGLLISTVLFGVGLGLALRLSWKLALGSAVVVGVALWAVFVLALKVSFGGWL